MTTILHDDSGNTAKIEEKMILPYKDSPNKEKAFVLSITADYDNDFLYFLSVYETKENALKKLKEFSFNSWK